MSQIGSERDIHRVANAEAKPGDVGEDHSPSHCAGQLVLRHPYDDGRVGGEGLSRPPRHRKAEVVALDNDRQASGTRSFSRVDPTTGSSAAPGSSVTCRPR